MIGTTRFYQTVRYGTLAYLGTGKRRSPAARLNCIKYFINCAPSLFQEENEKNKRRATVAQEEADVWKAKFDAERALRRALNAKVLDMQVGQMHQVAIGLTSLVALRVFCILYL